jgi:hypothetical protein
MSRPSARVETAYPDFSDLLQIVLATRGGRIVAFHKEKLPGWADVMQANLVKNIEQRQRLNASHIGGTAPWHGPA